MKKSEAIEVLLKAPGDDLAEMVNDMHHQQYGEPLPSDDYTRKNLIDWILRHYNFDGQNWESKRRLEDIKALAFSVITEADISPSRLLH